MLSRLCCLLWTPRKHLPPAATRQLLRLKKARPAYSSSSRVTFASSLEISLFKERIRLRLKTSGPVTEKRASVGWTIDREKNFDEISGHGLALLQFYLLPRAACLFPSLTVSSLFLPQLPFHCLLCSTFTSSWTILSSRVASRVAGFRPTRHGYSSRRFPCWPRAFPLAANLHMADTSFNSSAAFHGTVQTVVPLLLCTRRSLCFSSLL